MATNNLDSGTGAGSSLARGKVSCAARRALEHAYPSFCSLDPNVRDNMSMRKSCGVWYRDPDTNKDTCWARRLVLWLACESTSGLCQAFAPGHEEPTVLGICSFEKVPRSKADFSGYFVLVPFESSADVSLNHIHRGKVIGFFHSKSKEKDKNMNLEYVKDPKMVADKLKEVSKSSNKSKANDDNKNNGNNVKTTLRSSPSSALSDGSTDAFGPFNEVNIRVGEPSLTRARIEPPASIPDVLPPSNIPAKAFNQPEQCCVSEVQGSGDSELSRSEYCQNESNFIPRSGSSGGVYSNYLDGSEYTRGNFMFDEFPELVQWNSACAGRGSAHPASGCVTDGDSNDYFQNNPNIQPMFMVPDLSPSNSPLPLETPYSSPCSPDLFAHDSD